MLVFRGVVQTALKRKWVFQKDKGITRWWLNQPFWRICSSNWIISPGKGENKKYLKPPPRLCYSLEYTLVTMKNRPFEDDFPLKIEIFRCCMFVYQWVSELDSPITNNKTSTWRRLWFFQQGTLSQQTPYAPIPSASACGVGSRYLNTLKQGIWSTREHSQSSNLASISPKPHFSTTSIRCQGTQWKIRSCHYHFQYKPQWLNCWNKNNTK